MNRKMMKGLVAIAAAIVLAGCDRGFDPAAEIGLVSREGGRFCGCVRPRGLIRGRRGRGF